jgi:chaperonin GroEL (HSP60 family)
VKAAPSLQENGIVTARRVQNINHERSAMAISIDTIERLKSKLQAVPPKPRTEVESNKEAVLMLRTEVEKLRREGYDWNDVAELLKDDGQGSGIVVKGSTIKAFMAAPRPSTRRSKKVEGESGDKWPV